MLYKTNLPVILEENYYYNYIAVEKSRCLIERISRRKKKQNRFIFEFTKH